MPLGFPVKREFGFGLALIRRAGPVASNVATTPVCADVSPLQEP